MNLPRINELTNLISSLTGKLNNLNARILSLKDESLNTATAQDQLDNAVTLAKNRVTALSSLGLRSDFLEDIISPVQQRPDCSGIHTTVNNEISDAELKVVETNNSIGAATLEKRQLEMEEV